MQTNILVKQSGWSCEQSRTLFLGRASTLYLDVSPLIFASKETL